MRQGGSSEHVKHLKNNNHTDSYHKGIRVLTRATGMDDVLEIGLNGNGVEPEGIGNFPHRLKGSAISRLTGILDLLWTHFGVTERQTEPVFIASRYQARVD